MPALRTSTDRAELLAQRTRVVRFSTSTRPANRVTHGFLEIDAALPSLTSRSRFARFALPPPPPPRRGPPKPCRPLTVLRHTAKSATTITTTSAPTAPRRRAPQHHARTRPTSDSPAFSATLARFVLLSPRFLRSSAPARRCPAPLPLPSPQSPKSPQIAPLHTPMEARREGRTLSRVRALARSPPRPARRGDS